MGSLVTILGQASCSESPKWLDDPTQAMPATLSELGIYGNVAARSSVYPRAARYEPTLALWSNGSEKERFLVLPIDAPIDISDRDAWDFPVGTVFFKTFSFGTLPVETRVIRRVEDDWEYHAYQWNTAGTEANLLDLEESVLVPVEYQEEPFEHGIPSRRQCRMCHESNDTVIIGFDELRLNGASSDYDHQLTEFSERELFTAELPSDLDAVDAEDPTTEVILGYLHGNCSHCHNGRLGPNNAFSMRHPEAFENLINQMTTASGAIPGIRIIPGNPDDSIVYQAFTRTIEMAMPPVGIDLRDVATGETLRQWILDLE